MCEVGMTRLRCERYGARPAERLREPRQHREVGVKGYAFQPTDAQRARGRSRASSDQTRAQPPPGHGRGHGSAASGAGCVWKTTGRGTLCGRFEARPASRDGQEGCHTSAPQRPHTCFGGLRHDAGSRPKHEPAECEAEDHHGAETWFPDRILIDDPQQPNQQSEQAEPDRKSEYPGDHRGQDVKHGLTLACGHQLFRQALLRPCRLRRRPATTPTGGHSARPARRARRARRPRRPCRGPSRRRGRPVPRSTAGGR